MKCETMNGDFGYTYFYGEGKKSPPVSFTLMFYSPTLLRSLSGSRFKKLYEHR